MNFISADQRGSIWRTLADLKECLFSGRFLQMRIVSSKKGSVNFLLVVFSH